MRKLVAFFALIAIIGLFTPAISMSAPNTPSSSKLCGDDADGFKVWIDAFKKEAQQKGIKPEVLDNALDDISYSTKATKFDRNQKKSFKLSFEEFMKKRGAEFIVKKGRRLKAENAELLHNIRQEYGVPPGILLAIWGMESGFGRYTGKMKVIRSLATLSYDCRRSAFFTHELISALKIVQNGDMHPHLMIGAWAGEIGQTQFLASNYLKFAVDFDGDGKRDLIRSEADALASTANYLASFGWIRGKGYQKGEENFPVIEAWNRATIYQKALATIAKRIDIKNKKTK